MRLYRNCQEAIIDIGRELKKCANEVHTQTMQNKQVKDDEAFNTKELQAFSFAILDPSDKDMMPNISLDWCKAEIEERLSGKEINPGEAYLLREDVWKEFLIETPRGKKFEYTYAERMYWQYKAVLKELQIHPETRQAIIQIHDRRIDQPKMGRERVPCSLSYHLMRRNNALDIIYTMRSTDFITHFQNDIWLAIALQEWFAQQLNISLGKFIMFASSLHIYKRDWYQLSNY